jgi:signal transduction histidine kinase
MNQVLRHRLRNLASGVKSAVSYLAKELEGRLSAEEKEYFPLILKECDAISEITNRLNLLFDEVPGGELAAVSEVLDILKTRMHKRFPTTELRVGGDARCLGTRVNGSGWLLTALDEVVTNAVEAAPGRAVAIDCAEADGHLQVRVVDHGGGLGGETTERPFRAFSTTKTRHLGIGLAIAQGLLERLGGALAATSSPQGGTVVEVRLPRDTAAADGGGPVYGSVA